MKPPPGRGTFENDQPMILCCHQRGDRTVFTVPVNHDPLSSLICSTIIYGSTVYTDEYPAYRLLTEYGFEHDVVCQSTMMAIMISGAIYHFWNGATMGCMYTLFVGKGCYSIIPPWGFIINIGMMLAPWLIMMMGPFGYKYMVGYNIFVVALLAHLAYDAVLGVLAQRFVKEKGSIVTLRRQQQTVQ